MARNGEIVQEKCIFFKQGGSSASDNCDKIKDMLFQVLTLAVLLLLASAAYAAWQGAPWVPTWKRDLKRIDKLLCLQPGEKFVELGCGNARVCRHLKHAQPQADVVGVELSLLQYGIGWLQNLLVRSGVRMKLENVFVHDLSVYDAVYLFLMPETYQKIAPKLERELKPGSRVVCYVWPIPGWEPTYIDELAGAPKLYYYHR
jgi:SAM-dependent methyltransferase